MNELSTYATAPLLYRRTIQCKGVSILLEIPVSGNEYLPELTQFAENISIVDGPPVRVFGVPLPTRVIIVKLGDGSLWVN